MLTKPSRYSLALVSLLVFFMAAQAGVQGYVLCLGENGQAALEQSAGSACANALQHADEPRGVTFDRHSRDTHCGPCVDVPASCEVTSRRNPLQKNAAAPVALLTALSAAPRPAFVREFTADLHPQPPPRISRSILEHRTIVLLN